MKIFIGNDHSGVDIKNKLTDYILKQFNILVIDIGTNEKESCDYPEIAYNLCDNLLLENNYDSIAFYFLCMMLLFDF